MRSLHRWKLLIWISRKGAIRLSLSMVLIAAVVILLNYEYHSTSVWNTWALPLSGKTIAVDAGHGGVDGGASSKEGVLEKDINLAIALQLRDYLQQAGATVVLTRDSDTDLANPATQGLSRRKTEDLHARVALIQKHHADMLVSIHLNSIPSSRWHGAQTFYYPGNEDGKRLATDIQEQIKTSLHNTDRAPNIQASFYLLKALDIPGALVEIGFLSNPEEAKLMQQKDYQTKMAESVYRGILQYYAEDGKSSAE